MHPRPLQNSNRHLQLQQELPKVASASGDAGPPLPRGVLPGRTSGGAPTAPSRGPQPPNRAPGTRNAWGLVSSVNRAYAHLSGAGREEATEWEALWACSGRGFLSAPRAPSRASSEGKGIWDQAPRLGTKSSQSSACGPRWAASGPGPLPRRSHPRAPPASDPPRPTPPCGQCSPRPRRAQHSRRCAHSVLPPATAAVTEEGT